MTVIVLLCHEYHDQKNNIGHSLNVNILRLTGKIGGFLKRKVWNPFRKKVCSKSGPCSVSNIPVFFTLILPFDIRTILFGYFSSISIFFIYFVDFALIEMNVKWRPSFPLMLIFTFNETTEHNIWTKKWNRHLLRYKWKMDSKLIAIPLTLVVALIIWGYLNKIKIYFKT